MVNQRQTHIFHNHGWKFQISQVLGYVPEKAVGGCKANRSEQQRRVINWQRYFAPTSFPNQSQVAQILN